MTPRDFHDILGVLTGFLGRRPGQPEVVGQLQELLASLVYHAPTKWGTRRRSFYETTRCGVYPGCHRAAVHYCGVCDRDVCTVHAFVNSDADMVCNACVQAARTARAAPPGPGPAGSRYGDWDASEPFDPRYEEGFGGYARERRRREDARRAPPDPEQKRRQAALKVLGLDQSASWEEIHERFRELSVKHHPDRHPRATPTRRARLEAKFKAISEAYHYLERARRAA